MRRGNLAERTAPDGWILHCVQNDIRESASVAHKPPPRVIASASVAISREGNETTAHTTKTKKTKKNKYRDKVF